MTTTLTKSELIDYISSIETLLHNAKVSTKYVEDMDETVTCYELAHTNIVEAQASLMDGNNSDCKAYLNLCAEMIYALGNELYYGFNATYSTVGRMCFMAAQAL